MLYVVRHGQTDWNKKKLVMGSRNIPLNKEGREQAEKLKMLLYGYNYSLIICSPLKRAMETANIINNERCINSMYDSRLMERELGTFEGKPYISDNNLLWDINVNYSNNNVETMKSFRDRICEFLSYVATNYSETNVLAVTHGGVSALINSYMNGTLYDGPITDKFLGNCEIAEYDLTKVKHLKK